MRRYQKFNEIKKIKVDIEISEILKSIKITPSWRDYSEEEIF